MANEMVDSCCICTLPFQLAYDESPILHSNALLHDLLNDEQVASLQLFVAELAQVVLCSRSTGAMHCHIPDAKLSDRLRLE